MKLAKKLKLQIKPHFAMINTADNTKHDVNDCIDVTYELNGIKKTVRTLLCPTLSIELILGYDFWKIFNIKPTIAGISLVKGDTNIGSDREQVDTADKHSLTHEQIKQLNEVMKSFNFGTENYIGRTQLIKHVIKTPSISPDQGIRVPPYRISPPMQKLVDQDIERMLRLKVIEKCNTPSPWCLPIITVPKSDGSLRVCIDGRKLNKVTEKDAYPMPYMNRILSNVRRGKYFSKIDLTSAFWQIEVEPESQSRLTFAVPNRGTYRFVRMPFGIKNAPATLARLMDRVLGFDLEPNVFVYLDDIIVVSDTFEEHLNLLQQIGHRFSNAGLTISLEKSVFCLKSVKFCGFIVNEHGRQPNMEKIDPIINYPIPKTKRELRRFLGMCNWFHGHIKNMQGVVAPLNELLKGKYKKTEPIHMNEKSLNAFEQVKKLLINPQVLSMPDFSKPFFLETDASLHACGAVLFQEWEGERKIIEYWSKKLNKAQQNYSAVERELLAIVLACEHFRGYIEGSEFTIHCDNSSLQFLESIKNPTNRLARWAVRLQQFSFTVIHKAGKDNTLADALSRIVCSLLLEEPEDEYVQLRQQVTDNPERHPNMKVIDNVLYKNIISVNEQGLEMNEWKLYVPQMSRNRILKENHDLAGHFGSMKTINRIRKNYYWPGMFKDIRNYVRRCETCKASKSPNFDTTPPMGEKKKATRNFELISMDFMGEFPRSYNGNKYLLVTIDYVSKFVLMKATRSQDAKAVYTFMENEIILKFGCPRIVLSDNGSAFKSQTFRNLLSRYKIKQQLIANYAPWVNNTERVNRVIGDTLRACLDTDQKKWDEFIPYIQWAINSSIHEGTKFSPYYTVFCQKNKISGLEYEIEDVSGTSDDQNQDEILQEREREFQFLHEVIQASLKNAYEKNKNRYDMRKKLTIFNVGDTVFKKNFVKSSKVKSLNAKLCPKFVKCRVKKALGQNTYELCDFFTGKSLGIFHAKHMIKAC